MDGPVGFLAFGAAVLQDVSIMHRSRNSIGGRIITTTRRQLAQLDLPVFRQLVPSGLQFAQGSEADAMMSDVNFGDWRGKGREKRRKVEAKKR